MQRATKKKEIIISIIIKICSKVIFSTIYISITKLFEAGNEFLRISGHQGVGEIEWLMWHHNIKITITYGGASEGRAITSEWQRERERSISLGRYGEIIIIREEHAIVFILFYIF